MNSGSDARRVLMVPFLDVGPHANLCLLLTGQQRHGASNDQQESSKPLHQW